MISDTVVKDKETVEKLFKKNILVNNMNSKNDLDSIDTIIFLTKTLQPNPLLQNKNK